MIWEHQNTMHLDNIKDGVVVQIHHVTHIQIFQQQQQHHHQEKMYMLQNMQMVNMEYA